MTTKVTVKTKDWDKLRKRLPDGSIVKVGVLAGSGNASSGSISMLELAAIHEFGSPKNHIPQRSFIRATFERAEVAKTLQLMGSRFAKAIVNDKMTGRDALDKMGAWAAAQIKKTIKNRQTTGPDSQANKPETIARKGSSTPLVDTGRLVNAISWMVVLGGK